VSAPVTLYSLSDVATIMGVGPSAVSNWRKRGSGPHLPEPEYVTAGGRPLFTAEQLRELVADWNARAEAVLANG
jgi:hypothetical protein